MIPNEFAPRRLADVFVAKRVGQTDLFQAANLQERKGTN
jgi:hypothetical protein